jgi:hypothetical protein
MRNLKEYIEECEGVALATPANTIGMGNPGIAGPDALTEPIKSITAKSKKEKLKKKIKESLLDDEEDLIKDVKEFSNNPFQFIAALISRDEFLIYHKQEIEKLFDKVIKTIKSKSSIELVVQPRGIKIQLQRYDSDPLIILRPGHLFSKNDDPYGFPGDQQIVVFFTELFMEDYVNYGFKGEKQYFDWIHEFTKKYNLKKSKKDEFVYYI